MTIGLTLNGISIPVLRRSAKVDHVAIQDQARAYDGTPRKTIRARKRRWTLEIAPQSQTMAVALRGLINGDGHSWSFDTDLYSSKGLAPSSAGTASIQAGGKYGSLMRVPAATSITWATNLGTSWTVIVWRLESGTWKHYVVTAGGHKWVDGVRNDAASTTFISVSSGSLTITGASSLTDFDDLRALPYLIDDTWGASFRSEDNTNACSLLPRLNAGGDITFTGGPVSVLGDTGESDTQVFFGATTNNGESLAFTLEEC